MLFPLVFVAGLLAVASCQETEARVNYYVSGIEQVEQEALNYDFPENSYTYFQQVDEYKDCQDAGSYDFIIAGAGSSGSVLASRLSEVGSFKVLLLEAGVWENDFTDIPGIADYFRASNYSWGYNVHPQRNIFGGYLNHQIQVPRGKAIAGSSVINAMIYARGNSRDYDKWGPDWSYDKVLKYFKKSENATFAGSDDGYHGHNGTLHVEYSKIFDVIGEAFLEAAEILGYKRLDYNGKEQMGFDRLQMNEENGVRDSGARAFLYHARSRPNLHISPESFVLKVHIDDDNRASGVKFIRNGKLYYAKACKEVIVSAGTLQTPQILMLSGVGPCEHLNELGIPCKKHLHVGENLWDHLIYNTQAYSINYTYESTSLNTQVREYLDGSGPLTSPDSVQCVGYVSVLTGTDTVPDTEHVLHTGRPAVQSCQYYKQLHRYTNETCEFINKPQENISQWSIHSVLLHPESRGVVRLKSANPFDFPDVDPHYFSKKADVETMLLALRNVEKLANTSALQKYNSKLIKVVHPLCKHFEYGSDDFWRCMVVNLAETVHHFGGTAKMGPADDPTAVVNYHLQVHGIRNLRVVDCSIIPSSTSGHTNAPAYMIAEKAADIIKEAYRFPCCDQCSKDK